MKHHPASVDLELVKRLVLSTKYSNLQSFLYKEFACISKDYAGLSNSNEGVLCAVQLLPEPNGPACTHLHCCDILQFCAGATTMPPITCRVVVLL